jgi:hypothetical protein
MLDYICFDDVFTNEFKAYLEQRGVSYECREDDMGTIVAIPDDLDEVLDDDIDERFESLERAYERRLKQELMESEKNISAISVNLADGETCYVPIPEEMMNRLMTVLSPQEIGDLVDAIVSVVENPDTRPICHHNPDDEALK